MNSRYDPIHTAYALALVSEFKNQLLTEMERQCMTRADFARSIGWTRSAVSHFFNESKDINIRTADLCGAVLGGHIEFRFVSRENAQ